MHTTPADAARAAGLAGQAAEAFSHYLLGRLARYVRNADPDAYAAMVRDALDYGRDLEAQHELANVGRDPYAERAAGLSDDVLDHEFEAIRRGRLVASDEWVAAVLAEVDARNGIRHVPILESR